QADRVVELGPEAGSGGGQIVADGTPKQLSRRKTATARALKPALSDPGSVRREPRAWLRVTGARENNLSGFDVDLPLGVLCAVTGPSGSGKTTLAVDIVYRALCRQLGQLDSEPPGAFSAIRATEAVREVR